MPAKTSAGLLMFRKTGDGIEVVLAHPGGPFFKNKDEGAWTIPKGEASPGEDLLSRARIEFEEELGVEATGEFTPLGWVIQKGGKTVHAWAVEGDLPKDFECKSNTFEIEWPPRSGKMRSFPEVDRAEFFDLETARKKIKSGQELLLEELKTILKTA